MSDEPQQLGSIADEFRKLWGIPDAPAVVETDEERVKRLEELASRGIRDQRMQRFMSLCPPRFREKIDRSKIPNLEAWDLADSWNGRHPGVWLWSHETGEAKSRMLWRKFGQLHVEQGKTVIRMTGQQMVEEYFHCHMEGRPGSFYAMLTKYQIVMLDDLDKMDIGNDRVPRMLRETFDRFYEGFKPVLVTSNEPIAWFEQHVGKSTARRMREVCNEIAF